MTWIDCCSKKSQILINATRPMLPLLCCIGLAQSSPAQTLFTYGKYPVSKPEFLASFKKNAPAEGRHKAMEEYLPLYINYKLKVRSAYDERLDTLESQKSEAAMYRQQLEEGFLQQQSGVNQLAQEAFHRSKADILLGHIFFPFNPTDTASIAHAKRTAQLAFGDLKKGQPFDKVANTYNENGQPANGVAGWITAFTLPYKFETVVYNAGKGGYTEPVGGSDGYHIFKQLDQRPAVGKVTVAQILLWLPAQANDVDIAVKELLADSIYNSLKKGASFDQLALQYSNDRTSYATGGQLPEFGVGEYDPAFEAQAFSLQQSGDISKPFRTSFGIHILKLIDRQQPGSIADTVEALENIKLKVQESGRQQTAKENYLKKMLPLMGFKQAGFKKQDLWQFTDSALHNSVALGNPLTNKSLLFSFGVEKVLVENWILYLRGVPRNSSNPAAVFEKLWEQYIMQSAEAHYKKNISKYEPTYAAQLKEFKEANLLFQAMDNHVWSAAMADTAGLKRHYEANKNKYTWQDGVIALSVASTDSISINRFKNELMDAPNEWRKAVVKYNQVLMADSGRYEVNQLPTERFNGSMKAGASSTIFHNPVDNSFSFVYLFGTKAGGDIRSFEEAKGWVISDYQQVLETKWIAALRKKYPVKVNDPVWQQTLKVN